MQQYDWSKPQRQPVAGLAIVFIHTLWAVFKAVWPVLLVIIFNRKSSINKFEVISAVLLSFTLLTAFFRFIYFRFHIEKDQLIIRHGWLSKNVLVIPLEKIQTVHVQQGLLHQLLNIVKVSIDTAGSEKEEGRIDALHQSMAIALRERLQLHNGEAAEENAAPAEELLITLSTSDLLKLSISANHLEAFFLMLSFGYGLYENIRSVGDGFLSRLTNSLPAGSFYALMGLIVFVLFTTIIVSTVRIILRFYHFRLTKTDRGYRIRSGLTNINERLVNLSKIQFISWHANWIRRLMRLWLMEFHVGGGEHQKTRTRVQIPVTQDAYVHRLADSYHSLPDVSGIDAIRMHKDFIARRFLLLGLLPCIVAIVSFWWLAGPNILLVLIYALLVTILAWCSQRKFRLWAMNDVLFLKTGLFGESWKLLKWERIQVVEMKQSPYQRSHLLANLIFFTAGGHITLRYIDLATANALMDYALLIVESRGAQIHSGIIAKQ